MAAFRTKRYLIRILANAVLAYVLHEGGQQSVKFYMNVSCMCLN